MQGRERSIVQPQVLVRRHHHEWAVGSATARDSRAPRLGRTGQQRRRAVHQRLLGAWTGVRRKLQLRGPQLHAPTSARSLLWLRADSRGLWRGCTPRSRQRAGLPVELELHEQCALAEAAFHLLLHRGQLRLRLPLRLRDGQWERRRNAARQLRPTGLGCDVFGCGRAVHERWLRAARRLRGAV